MSLILTILLFLIGVDREFGDWLKELLSTLRMIVLYEAVDRQGLAIELIDYSLQLMQSNPCLRVEHQHTADKIAKSFTVLLR